MKMDLVFNPVAGGFRPRKLDRLVAAFRAFGVDVEPLATATEGVRLSGSAELVCVHGGDGTLRDTVQALGEHAGRVPLAIAPSGTINLVARELGYHRDPDKLARQISGAWARGPESWARSPLYTLGDMPIVSCLSIGPDSLAVANVSGALKKRIGRYAYVVAMMRQLRTWERTSMTIRGELADGNWFECEAEAAIVSHGALYAGPFRLSPRAALHEDSVELVTVRRSTRTGIGLLTAASMLRLPVEKLRHVEMRTCKRIEFDRCVTPVQVDGDHLPDCAYAIGPSGMTLRYVV